ncbi:putative phage transmembrane protein [Burkholderia multivorans]
MSDVTPDKARVEDRLRAGDRRFSRLERRIDESDAAVKSHLQQQDEKIDEVVSTVAKIQANTQFMVDTWESGARAVRFLCRLADAWRFLSRQVAIPVMAFGAVALIVIRYARHEPVPDWANLIVKLLVG